MPCSYDKETLAVALRTHPDLRCGPSPPQGPDGSVMDIDGGCNDATVFTLALALRRRTLEATVRFRHVPSRLQDFQAGAQLTVYLCLHPSSHESRKEKIPQSEPVTIDDRFDDLTVLHSPPPGDHIFDILVASGLDGHAFESFVHRQDGNMWLAENLPKDIHSARVILYGSYTPLQNSNSFAELCDLSGQFYQALARVMQSASGKHMIMIGHDLGGLLIKEAIIKLFTPGTGPELPIQIAGCLFFGVPSDGMNIEPLVPMVGDRPNRSLLGSLRQENSYVLKNQRTEFASVLEKHKLEIFCFYETERSPTAREVSN